MVTCPGGPILEIPQKGRFIFERLSPGTIREPDFYDEFRIIPGARPGTKLLVACPRGATKRGKCSVGQRALRIWHDRRELRRILTDCKSGALSKRRASMMKRIREDVKRMRNGRGFGALSQLAHGIFSKDSSTLPGRALQFAVNAVLGTLISVAVIRTFFPGMFGRGAPAVTAPKPGTQDGLS